MTVDDVARLLQSSREAVYARIERGQIPGVVRVGRRVYVRRDDLRRALGLDPKGR